MRRQLLPPFRCDAVVLRRLAPLGQRLQRLGVPAGQPVALRFHPTLELTGITQIEAVQERTLVLARRRLPILALERVLEGAHVAADHFEIQTQHVTGAEHGVLAQRPAQHVEGIGEVAAGPLLLAIRPQITQQFAAGQALFTSAAE